MSEDLDIRICASHPDHRKTRFMVALLGEVSYRCLHRLFIYTARHHPRGVLEGMSAMDIAMEAGWNLNVADPLAEAQRYVNTLVNTPVRYLDFDGTTYSIHDWREHQEWMYFKPERQKKARKANAKKHGFLDLDAGTDEPDTATHRPTPNTPHHTEHTEHTESSTPKPAVLPASSSPPSPLPVPNPIPSPFPAPPAQTAVPLPRHETAVTAGPLPDQYRAAKAALSFIHRDWSFTQVMDLVNQLRKRCGDAIHITEPAYLWPIATAHFLMRTKKQGIRNPVTYCLNAEGEPADTDREHALALLKTYLPPEDLTHPLVPQLRVVGQ